MLTFDRMLHELRTDAIDARYVEHPIGALREMLEGARQEGDIAADLDGEVLATALWNLQQGTRAYLLRTGNSEMANATLALLLGVLERTADSASSSSKGAAG